MGVFAATQLQHQRFMTLVAVCLFFAFFFAVQNSLRFTSKKEGTGKLCGQKSRHKRKASGRGVKMLAVLASEGSGRLVWRKEHEGWFDCAVLSFFEVVELI